VNTFAVTASPGLTWFVTRFFAIEAQVGQIQYISSDASEFGTDHLLISRQRTTAFGISFNPQTFLMGVTFYMGERKSD
jgi:hypothetical protein